MTASPNMIRMNSLPAPWHDRRILLGVTGGIAAYKMGTIASTLAKEQAQVRTILTAAAQQFVSPLTFSTLCRHPTYTDTDFWSGQHPRPLHIDLGEWAELIVLAPVTANSLAKLALGIADNLLTNTVLASTCPLLLAPAMNTDMWEQASVQQYWQTLLAHPRYHCIPPVPGILACDRQGIGRMAEPSSLLTWIESILHSGGQRDWQGRRVLVTAGGTKEYWDPVRFLGNPASGRMGVALALAAAHRGATVTLVGAGFTPEALPHGLAFEGVTTALEMEKALTDLFPQQDWLLMAAAVADVRPAQRSPVKVPKADLPECLMLEDVPDLVAQLAAQKRDHQRVVGFAAQTGEIIGPAQEKLRRKKLDAIVANPVDQPVGGFGSVWNQGVILDRLDRQQKIDPCTKLSMAHQILDFIAPLGNR